MTVSGNGVGHVEVAHVLNQVSAVEVCFTVWFVSLVLETRRLDEVVLNQVGSKLGNSCSKFLYGVVRKWRTKLFRESTNNLPVVLGKAWS